MDQPILAGYFETNTALVRGNIKDCIQSRVVVAKSVGIGKGLGGPRSLYFFCKLIFVI